MDHANNLNETPCDVVVVGAGVAGSAIARELARYRLRTCVLEAGNDIACGATRANSGIVHAGYDPLPGTLKARYNAEGSRLYPQWADELGFSYRRNGSWCWRSPTRKWRACARWCGARRKTASTACASWRPRTCAPWSLRRTPARKAPSWPRREPSATPTRWPFPARSRRRNTACASTSTRAVRAVQPLDARDARRWGEGDADGAGGAVGAGAPGAGGGSAAGAAAGAGGVRVSARGAGGDGASSARGPFRYAVTTEGGARFVARAVANAAGVFADEVNNLVSERKLRITPRRGEYCLYDTEWGGAFSHTMFQAPSSSGKGVLVTPTVHGNLLVGPSAVEQFSKTDVSTRRRAFPSSGRPPARRGPAWARAAWSRTSPGCAQAARRGTSCWARRRTLRASSTWPASIPPASRRRRPWRAGSPATWRRFWSAGEPGVRRAQKPRAALRGFVRRRTRRRHRRRRAVGARGVPLLRGDRGRAGGRPARATARAVARRAEVAHACHDGPLPCRVLLAGSGEDSRVRDGGCRRRRSTSAAQPRPWWWTRGATTWSWCAAGARRRVRRPATWAGLRYGFGCMGGWGRGGDCGSGGGRGRVRTGRGARRACGRASAGGSGGAGGLWRARRGAPRARGRGGGGRRRGGHGRGACGGRGGRPRAFGGP